MSMDTPQQLLQKLLQNPSVIANDLIGTINHRPTPPNVHTFVKLFLDLVRAEGSQVLTATTSEIQYTDNFPTLGADSFPVLGAAAAEQPKQPAVKKPKQKKRVRPTAVKKAGPQPQGSIERVVDSADFPSLGPSPANQITARKSRAPLQQVPEGAPATSKPNPFSQAPWGAAPPEKPVAETPRPATGSRDPEGLAHIARLHAAIVNCHWLVCGRLSAELMLLVQLLLAESQQTSHTSGQLLNSSADCAHYAACALADLGHWVIKLGKRAAQALCDSAPFCSRCPELAATLRDTIQQQQAAGHSPRSRTGISSSLDLSYFTVPFCAVSDSRHAFRTPNDSKLYNNREKLRDKLVLILELHSSLLSEHRDAVDPVRDAVREFMSELDPLNTPWFAGHFVDVALQHGLAHHDGAAIAAMNRHGAEVDSDKISKLHRRFSSKHLHTASRPGAVQVQGPQVAAKLFEMRHLDDSFELILSIADSHALSTHLVTQLAGRISQLTSAAATDSISELVSDC